MIFPQNVDFIFPFLSIISRFVLVCFATYTSPLQFTAVSRRKTSARNLVPVFLRHASLHPNNPNKTTKFTSVFLRKSSKVSANGALISWKANETNFTFLIVQ